MTKSFKEIASLSHRLFVLRIVLFNYFYHAGTLMPSLKAIPTVQFYGELTPAITPDLLHCESLLTRSQKHKFKIKPHRHHELCQIFYIKEGSGEANIDGVSSHIVGPSLLVIPPMCIHDFAWSHTIQGTVITITAPLITMLEKYMQKEALVINSTLFLTLQEGRKEFEMLLDLLVAEYQAPPSTLRVNALFSLMQLMATWLERHTPKIANNRVKQRRASHYFNQFNHMINQDFSQHKKVEAYAAQLGITGPYLNAICQQLVAKNAQQLIHDRIILEAKRNLLYSVVSVSEIAYALGFNDPAYFTRFFKRLTAQSPKAFRQKQHASDSIRHDLKPK